MYVGDVFFRGIDQQNMYMQSMSRPEGSDFDKSRKEGREEVGKEGGGVLSQKYQSLIF